MQGFVARRVPRITLQNKMGHFQSDVEPVALKEEFPAVRPQLLRSALCALDLHGLRR
jgi:hypothetical protein